MPVFPSTGTGVANVPGAGVEPNVVEVEFKDHVSAAVATGEVGAAALSSGAGVDLTSVQSLLTRYDVQRAEPSFTLALEEATAAQMSAQAVDPAAPNPRNFVMLHFPGNVDVRQVAQELSLLPDVVRAVPVPRAVPPIATPGNEPLTGSSDQLMLDTTTGLENQWYLFRCGVNTAWSRAVGTGVVIADIDWGYHITHQDLKPRLDLANAYNTYDGGTNVSHGGSISHGTAVLGIAGGADNELGVAGVAPEAVLWPIQANSGPGAPLSGNAWANAIDWVRRRDSGGRRKVIILEVQTGSLGNYEQLPSVSAAIRLAIAEGVVVCVAAGNGDRHAGIDDQGHPFAETGSILVGATEYHPQENRRAWFSNFGPSVVVAAPGDANHDLACSSTADNAYQNPFGGTSGATPKVAGTVALMLSANPHLSHQEIRDILRNTGAPVVTDAGRPVGTFLNADAAVREAVRRRDRLSSYPDPGLRPRPQAFTPTNPRLASATSLAEFLHALPPASGLSRSERLLSVDQALLLLENFYVHRLLKEAMYALRPIQRLRLLRFQIEQTSESEMGSDLRFHNEMTQIFVSLRDLHTNYLLPAPYNGKTAFLPFLVEAYYENGVRMYLVSRTIAGFTHPTFVPGVEITRWNGVPMDRAVEINADLQAGSNRDARHARGLEAMTIRPLVISLPPDAEWETIGYRTKSGAELELRQAWQVFTPPPGAASGVAAGEGIDATAQGLDLQTEAVRQAKQLLYAPETVTAPGDSAAPPQTPLAATGGTPTTVVGLDLQTEAVRQVKQIFFAPESLAQSAHLEPRAVTRESIVRGADIPTQMPGIFRAREVVTPSGTFGHIRIFTFSVSDADVLVAEFVRLAAQLPQNGLILDVRGNGGGLIYAGERLLQVLTPRRIESERLQFINTPLNLEMCRRHRTGLELEPWVESISESVATGAVYSRGFPITSEESCNAIGQKYVGPVVLIIDALCYSTTDIFAAGFQDHQIGPILGVHGHTGAGGANVWTHGLLQSLFSGPGSPFKPLPQGAGMRVAIRQTIRVGPQAGTLVEDRGVVPDAQPQSVHRMTRNDLLHDNVDLLARAGQLLAVLPVFELVIREESRSGGRVSLAVRIGNLDRLDFYLNDRPQQSLNVTDGEVPFEVTVSPRGPTVLLIRGYRNGECVAARHHAL